MIEKFIDHLFDHYKLDEIVFILVVICVGGFVALSLFVIYFPYLLNRLGLYS